MFGAALAHAWVSHAAQHELIFPTHAVRRVRTGAKYAVKIQRTENTVKVQGIEHTDEIRGTELQRPQSVSL
eukprot:244132-Chlamydomonas_euryale.AAC.16